MKGLEQRRRRRVQFDVICHFPRRSSDGDAAASKFAVSAVNHASRKRSYATAAIDTAAAMNERRPVSPSLSPRVSLSLCLPLLFSIR